MTPCTLQLVANPNPVPAGPEPGTTTVTWNTGDGSIGRVYVSVDGHPEVLFVEGSAGSEQAPWIVAGRTYTFRLCTRNEQAATLATLTVPTVDARIDEDWALTA